MQHWPRLCLLPLAVWTSACGPSPEQWYAPDDTQPIRQWYHEALGAPAESAPALGLLPHTPAADTLPPPLVAGGAPDFVRLPNPALLLYVYPHFGAHDTPIPGYATRFFLFRQTPIRRNTR